MDYLVNDLIDKGIDAQKAMDAVLKMSDSNTIYKHFGIPVPSEFDIKQAGGMDLFDFIANGVGNTGGKNNKALQIKKKPDAVKGKEVLVCEKFDIFKEKPQDIFFPSEKPEKFYDFTYQGPVKLECSEATQSLSMEFDFDNPSSIPKINLKGLNSNSNRGVQLLTEFASKLIINEKNSNLNNQPLINYLINSYLNSS